MNDDLLAKPPLNKELVTRSTAELALKKGFDEYTDKVCLKDGIVKLQYGFVNYPKKIFPDVINLPTQSQLHAWLRNKHNIVITIHYIDKWYGDIALINVKSLSRPGSLHGETWEEAMEESLEHALNLIDDETLTLQEMW